MLTNPHPVTDGTRFRVAPLGTAVLAAIAWGSALGGEAAYQCTIQASQKLDDRGRVVTDPLETFVGSTFAVDRKDGRIVDPGGYFANAGAKVTVLNPGSSEWSFKSVSIWAVNEFRTLVVKEFVTGSRKPFLMTDSWGAVYSGTCE